METELEELETRFRRFADEAAKFSLEIMPTVPAGEKQASRAAEANVDVARTLFGKWSMEILSILYHIGTVGFEELRRRLGSMSPRVLSQKLKVLESQGLVERIVKTSRPIGVRYTLTEKGLTLTKLGQPVFLYLGLKKIAGISRRFEDPDAHSRTKPQVLP